jgi:TonB family protein
MSEKEKMPQEKIKTILIIALLVTVIILLVIILFREPQTKVVYQNNPVSSGDRNARGSEVSPYVKNEVRNTIAKKWKEMNDCYNEFLKSTPPPKVTDGMVSLDWQVDSNGEVISPEVVASQINHPVLEKCLVSIVKTWKFPPPPPIGRNAYVLYKFNFKKTD